VAFWATRKAMGYEKQRRNVGSRLGKPTKSLSFMKIIIDTREQQVLEFSHFYITEIKRQKLLVGDYMVEFSDSYRPPISIERKSLEDIFGTLSQGYKRFRKEIIRAKDNKIMLVIAIEASLSKILKGCEPCIRSGEEILQQLMSINVKYGVPFYCFNNRIEMQRWITELFLAFGRRYIDKKK